MTAENIVAHRFVGIMGRVLSPRNSKRSLNALSTALQVLSDETFWRNMVIKFLFLAPAARRKGHARMHHPDR